MNAINSGAGGIVVINTEEQSFVIQDPSVLSPLSIPLIMLPLSLRPILSGLVCPSHRLTHSLTDDDTAIVTSDDRRASRW
jgi:hypothetical protein